MIKNTYSEVNRIGFVIKLSVSIDLILISLDIKTIFCLEVLREIGTGHGAIQFFQITSRKLR